MNVHVEFHRNAERLHVARVILTETGQVIHETCPCDDNLEAWKGAREWVARQLDGPVRVTTNCPHEGAEACPAHDGRGRAADHAGAVTPGIQASEAADDICGPTDHVWVLDGEGRILSDLTKMAVAERVQIAIDEAGKDEPSDVATARKALDQAREALCALELPVAFTTDRLRVFSVNMVPSDANARRVIFIATRTDVDRPMVAATAMLWMEGAVVYEGPLVDWIEVASEYRRQGLGRELIAGIQEHLGGPVHMDGGSDDGRAFCAALEAAEMPGREARR